MKHEHKPTKKVSRSSAPSNAEGTTSIGPSCGWKADCAVRSCGCGRGIGVSVLRRQAGQTKLSITHPQLERVGEAAHPLQLLRGQKRPGLGERLVPYADTLHPAHCHAGRTLLQRRHILRDARDAVLVAVDWMEGGRRA